jgi:DNA-binding NarL/FixJ family response regulator
VELRDVVIVATCGTFCGKICLTVYEDIKGRCSSGFNLFKKVRTGENKIADILLIEIDGKLTTMMYPLDEKIAISIEEYRKYGLTPSEFKVGTLLMRGYSNRTIAGLLFISMSTFKKNM